MFQLFVYHNSRFSTRNGKSTRSSPAPHAAGHRSQETLHGIAQEDHVAAQCLDTHFLGVTYQLYQLIRTCRYTLDIYKLRFESEIIYKCRFDWETQI
jgi:hypothetical protein